MDDKVKKKLRLAFLMGAFVADEELKSSMRLRLGDLTPEVLRPCSRGEAVSRISKMLGFDIDDYKGIVDQVMDRVAGSVRAHEFDIACRKAKMHVKQGDLDLAKEEIEKVLS